MLKLFVKVAEAGLWEERTFSALADICIEWTGDAPSVVLAVEEDSDGAACMAYISWPDLKPMIICTQSKVSGVPNCGTSVWIPGPQWTDLHLNTSSGQHSIPDSWTLVHFDKLWKMFPDKRLCFERGWPYVRVLPLFGRLSLWMLRAQRIGKKYQLHNLKQDPKSVG